MKKNTTTQNKTKVLIGFLIGFLIGVVFVCIEFYGDISDQINTKALGMILCNEQGMVYDYREIVSIQIDGKDYKDIPKIYCKIENETQLIDGIVVTQDQTKKVRDLLKSCGIWLIDWKIADEKEG